MASTAKMSAIVSAVALAAVAMWGPVGVAAGQDRFFKPLPKSPPSGTRPTGLAPPVGSAQVGRDGGVVWTKMIAESQTVPGRPGAGEHTVELEGSYVAPPVKTLDAVAVSELFKLAGAIDSDKRAMTRTGSSSRSRSSSVRFRPIHNGRAAVEVKKTALSKAAHHLDEVIVNGTVVVAQRREEIVLPAVVMEDMKSLPGGMKLQVTQLRVRGVGTPELTVVANYTKPTQSTERNLVRPKAPFVEAVYAIDTNGNEIGGGRWTEGDPLKPKGNVTYTFKVPAGSDHAKFRFVIVTESVDRPIQTKTKGVFGY